MTLIPYIRDDVDFLTYIGNTVPEARGVIARFATTPDCTTCQKELVEVDKKLADRREELIQGFRDTYKREPKTKVEVNVRTLLIGDFVINPATYKEFVREKASRHRWTAMQTTALKDGTWRISFS